MYFETPVLAQGDWYGGAWAVVARPGDRKPREDDLYCCWEGLEAWFRDLDAARVRVVVCFSTKPVAKAKESLAMGRVCLSLTTLFADHNVLPGDPIWWWVEIVIDG